MNKVNLKDLAESIIDLKYCIIKLSPDFPDYNFGADLDIITDDIDSLVDRILAFLNCQMIESRVVEIEKKQNKVVIDLFENNKLNLRFDLIHSMPKYKFIEVKSSLLPRISREGIIRTFNGCDVRVPCEMDDALIRYLEFHEWFSIRPDKIKHISIIESLILSGKIDRELFLEHVHSFIKLVPNIDTDFKYSNGIVARSKRVARKVKTGYNLLRKDGVLFTIDYLKKKFTVNG